MKTSFAAIAAAFLICSASSPVLAHATLEISEAVIGSGYKGVVRVPHGCNGQATQAVRVSIPDEIVNVKPMPKAGWQLSVTKGPYATPFNNHGKVMSEGVKEIAWSNGNLPDEFYDEFVFSGTISPAAVARTVYVPVVQECANGAERWVEIPAAGQDSGSLKAPAPRLQLAAGEMVHAEEKIYTAGALKITAPWVRATPKSARMGGGYLKITNTGKESDRLVGGTFPGAAKVEVHEMATVGGVMKMRQLTKGLEIKPGQTIELKPGSFHVMLMGLSAPIATGKPVKASLQFEKAGKVDIEFMVAPIGAKEMPGMAGHDMHLHH